VISVRRPPRPLLVGAALLLVGVVVAAALLTLPAWQARPGWTPAASRSTAAGPTAAGPTPTAAVPALASVSPSPSGFPSGFVPIDLTAPPPIQWLAPTDAPGDSIFRDDPGRPIPSPSEKWLALKSAGRIALSGGRIVTLGGAVDPLTDPQTGEPVPQSRRLDLDWTRWIVEPYGDGTDVKGNRYTDRSYWNLCGPGAVTVALYYWQQLTGYPDVTGTAGYFLDPYEAAGAAWPKRGPVFVSPDGNPQMMGTYWAGSDSVDGFTAHGRGFVMYLAMAVRPTGWTSTGLDIFVDGDGTARYPTLGAPPRYMMAGLNWEASNHHPTDWPETYYATVSRWSPTIARDLRTAAMLDIGRDGVAIVASADTFYLPNWLASNPAATPHTRHAIAIVGYDNTSNPPTYTYLDTCGRLCNSRGGNRNGQLHVISQAQLVTAITEAYGMGFIW
jgi:hypothetical protein